MLTNYLLSHLKNVLKYIKKYERHKSEFNLSSYLIGFSISSTLGMSFTKLRRIGNT